MKKRNHFFILLSCIGFLLVSCGKTSTSSETKNNSTDSLTEQSIEVSDESKKIEFKILADSGTIELVAGEEGSPSASFREEILVVTKVPNQTDLDAIQAILQKKQDYSGDAEQALAKKKKNYLEGYVEMNSEEVIGMSAEWDRDFRVDVLYNDNYLTTVGFYLDEYGGGAHSYYTASYLVLDLKNNKKVTLSDIFDANGIQTLTQKLTDKAKEIAKKEGAASMDDYGFLVEKVEPTERFIVTGNGIEFTYDRAEITPYVMPAPSFFFAWQEIEDIVKTNAPVRILMN